MPRKVKELPITTRTARAKLAPSGKPYFRLVGEGLHLGYRRPASPGRAGSWVARRRRLDGGYELAVIGPADDLSNPPPGGAGILTFEQALSTLRQWGKTQADAERAAGESGIGAPTVRQAVESYVAARLRRAPKAGADAKHRLARHVLASPLGDEPLHLLTEGKLLRWRETLSRGGRRRKGAAPEPLAPATEARLLNDLRAALAAAAARHRLDLAPVIRSGLKAPEAPDRARELQVLGDAEVRRVVEAAGGVDEDWGDLVLVLAATGARFDQIARASVADFQPAAGRLMVPASRKGRTGTGKRPVAVPLPAEVAAALQRRAAGRGGGEPLLTRWHHRKAAPSPDTPQHAWERAERRGWRDSSETSRPWRRTLEAAGLPRSLVPYCLRHSSVVRGLKAGLPVRLVAAAHDTSVAMIEKHYSAFIVDASEELLRRAMVSLGPAAMTKLASGEGP